MITSTHNFLQSSACAGPDTLHIDGSPATCGCVVHVHQVFGHPVNCALSGRKLLAMESGLLLPLRGK